MITQHAFLAPSSAHRWVRCPASPTLEAKYPESEDSEAARLGTAAHWVVEQALDNAPVSIGCVAPNGVVVTQEMIDGAEIMRRDIVTCMSKMGTNHSLPQVERHVNISVISPNNWGTPDVYAWDENTLYIWDYKFGHGHVEVFENWQLIDYAAGLIAENIDTHPSQIQVVLTVVQPRAFHPDGPVRSWETTAVNLAPYFHQLTMAADEAMSTSLPPQAKPTPEGCAHCKARHACATLQRAAYQGVAVANAPTVADLTPDALGLEMRVLHEAGELIKARMSGLEEQALALIRQAVIVPHWVLRPGTARTVWNVTGDEVISMGALLGLDLAKPREPITPAQAVKAGLDATIVATYSFKPQGAMKLTLDDGSDARRVFI